MVKKGYNWKARQVVKTVIDDSTTKQIHLDLDVDGHYDASNTLALPSQKRKTKIIDDRIRVPSALSKKHRKKLEKIVDKKKKKENRASLLEALAKVQATPEELSKLTSIASLQTKGLKRHFYEEAHPEKNKKPKRDSQIVNGEIKLNSLSGAKRRALLASETTKPHANCDPNVVGFESESENDSEDDDDAEAEPPSPTLPQAPPTIIIADKPPEITTPIEADKPPTTPTLPPIAKTTPPAPIKRQPAVFVDVIRSDEIQAARLKLPILAEEQQIMETINENNVIIVAGETGSGKTTQIPQFLYEAGYAKTKQIAVTEPRRVAAIAMSRRVAHEMNLSSREVSFLIRFEGNVTDDTKIKFMTDGVLLKEVQNDFLLSKYSVVVLDEAHERSVYTDILIGLLSRIVPMRCKRGDPLKLIVMSATLRVEDFTTNQRLFKIAPPVINVDSRQFPVTVHFNKRTPDNYIKEAFLKVVKIHTKLPDGAILVFMTGQREVVSLVRKLRHKFPLKTSKVSVEDSLKSTLKAKKKVIHAPPVDLDDYSIPGDRESDVEAESSGAETDDEDSRPAIGAQPLWVLPLYSLLPTAKQSRIFATPPSNCRLCVVSTNIAETSLTIPNTKYVVDTGKTKRKLYDKVTGVTSYVTTWTSKASANQRAGRAGRQGPGHAYRLFSSALFNDTFDSFAVPEIQLKPVDDLYLQMKTMNIDRIVNFPFPTAPDLLQLKTAEARLEVLGALLAHKVTALGRAIARFPVLPRFGKMLALSHQAELLPYTVTLVAALSLQEVLLERPIGGQQEAGHKWAQLRRKWAGTGNSKLLGDAMVLLRAVGAAEYANSQNRLEQFCALNGLRHKAIIEIRKLRLQLTSEINTNLPEAALVVDPQLAPPTDLQAKLLRQILLSGMGDQLAKKIDDSDSEGKLDKSLLKYGYHANNMAQPVFLHSGSVLRKSPPPFVIYQEIYETKKIYMRGVTAIEPEWLPTYVPSICNLSTPLADPPPFYKDGRIYCTVNGTFGSQAWDLGNVEMEHPVTVECYKWFGRYLLEGVVCPKLAKYSGVLLSQAGIMVKSWAKLQPRTDALLKGLMVRGVTTRAGLEAAWAVSPQYLLGEYLKWLPASAHAEVSLLWPPLD